MSQQVRNEVDSDLQSWGLTRKKIEEILNSTPGVANESQITALQKRLQDKTFEEIGTEMGIHHSAARGKYKAALRHLAHAARQK